MLKWFGRKAVLFWPISIQGWVFFLVAPWVWYCLMTPVGIVRLSWSDPAKLERHLYLSPLWGILAAEVVLNLIWFSSRKFENFRYFDPKKLVYSLLGAWIFHCFFQFNFWFCFLVLFLLLHANEKMILEKKAEDKNAVPKAPLPALKNEKMLKAIVIGLWVLDLILLVFPLFVAKNLGGNPWIGLFYFLVVTFWVLIGVKCVQTRRHITYIVYLLATTAVFVFLLCLGLMASIQPA